MKKRLAEFKTFALKGNVLDMAVGVVVGGAFTSIVNSVVADVLTPIISLVTPGMDFSAWHIGPIMIGNFINAVVSFLILAACVFAIVKGMNALMRKKEEAPQREQVAKETSAGAASAGDKTVQKQPVHKQKKPGRNDPCPCGSGLKYKKCCGRNE